MLDLSRLAAFLIPLAVIAALKLWGCAVALAVGWAGTAILARCSATNGRRRFRAAALRFLDATETPAAD